VKTEKIQRFHLNSSCGKRKLVYA